MEACVNECDPLVAADQQSRQTWQILRNGLKSALADRGHSVGERDLALITRFMLEYVEERGLLVVPRKPTRKMQAAIKDALGRGNRLSTSWVDPWTKQRWRYFAALDAAPNWRIGYEAETGPSELGSR